MSARDLLIVVLLVVGVGAVLIACLGAAAMPRFYARLHYIALATTLGAIALAGAIAVEEGTSGAGTKAFIAALVVAVGSPVLTHATARAAWIREHGRWAVPPTPPAPEAEQTTPALPAEGEEAK